MGLLFFLVLVLVLVFLVFGFSVTLSFDLLLSLLFPCFFASLLL